MKPVDKTKTSARRRRNAPARPIVGKQSLASTAPALQARSTNETPHRVPTAYRKRRRESPRQKPQLRSPATATTAAPYDPFRARHFQTHHSQAACFQVDRVTDLQPPRFFPDSPLARRNSIHANQDRARFNPDLTRLQPSCNGVRLPYSHRGGTAHEDLKGPCQRRGPGPSILREADRPRKPPAPAHSKTATSPA